MRDAIRTRIERELLAPRSAAHAHVDRLTLFGATAMALMLLFYALEPRSAHFVLAFAGACLASSMYGFLQGACPFGVVEAIWSLVALRRWWARSAASRRGTDGPSRPRPEGLDLQARLEL